MMLRYLGGKMPAYAATVLDNRIFRIIYYEYILRERERYHHIYLSAGVLPNILTLAIKMIRLCFFPSWSRCGEYDWHFFYTIITDSYQKVNLFPALQCVSRLWRHWHEPYFKLPVDSRMNERFNMGECSLIKVTYLPCPLCVLHSKKSRLKARNNNNKNI